VAALLGAGAVAAAAVVGVAWAAVDDTGEPVAVAAAGRVRWGDVLAGLDAARSRAFATADAAALATVYTDGSPALARDRAVVTRLADAGLHTLGLRPVTVEVRELSSTARRARLRVVDVLPGYRLVDDSGGVVSVVPGRGRVRWTVTLTRTGARWQVYDVALG
jgi:hypothetical protein